MRKRWNCPPQFSEAGKITLKKALKRVLAKDEKHRLATGKNGTKTNYAKAKKKGTRLWQKKIFTMSRRNIEKSNRSTDLRERAHNQVQLGGQKKGRREQ